MRYESTSKVVRSSRRILEQQENLAEASKNAINEGEVSGLSELSLKDITAQIKQMDDV